MGFFALLDSVCCSVCLLCTKHSNCFCDDSPNSKDDKTTAANVRGTETDLRHFASSHDCNAGLGEIAYCEFFAPCIAICQDAYDNVWTCWGRKSRRPQFNDKKENFMRR
ncbi:hypothetical protein HN51_003647 [Arachis hypogaea]